MTITELSKERLDDFFRYLERHLSENGANGASLFLPLSRERSTLTSELRSTFEGGLEREFGEHGWRRTWLAMDHANKVIGHVDIRSHAQLNTGHRVLLGMGVDRDHRRQKIGSGLLLHVIDHCRRDPRISWIDLDVISTNAKAIALYDKAGFGHVGTTQDKFRIDSISYAYSSMALNVDKEPIRRQALEG